MPRNLRANRISKEQTEDHLDDDPCASEDGSVLDGGMDGGAAVNLVVVDQPTPAESRPYRGVVGEREVDPYEQRDRDYGGDDDERRDRRQYVETPVQPRAEPSALSWPRG